MHISFVPCIYCKFSARKLLSDILLSHYSILSTVPGIGITEIWRRHVLTGCTHDSIGSSSEGFLLEKGRELLQVALNQEWSWPSLCWETMAWCAVAGSIGIFTCGEVLRIEVENTDQIIMLSVLDQEIWNLSWLWQRALRKQQRMRNAIRFAFSRFRGGS